MSRKKNYPEFVELSDSERTHYRDQIRAARYAALADAEAFSNVCFAIEELGLRLLRSQGDIGTYKDRIGVYAIRASVFAEFSESHPALFKKYDALYDTVRAARNDAMHIGAYARHATEAAIELCIGLEEGLMIGVAPAVADVMVKSPITVQSWHPVAYARQLMLMHSFSFLPVHFDNRWWLVSELGLAKYLRGDGSRSALLGKTVEEAKDTLGLIEMHSHQLLSTSMRTDDVLTSAAVKDGPMLWLVIDENRKDHLVGVLSPFELM